MFLDRILTKQATANGTGNITWTTAVTQYALPPTGVNTTVDYTILDANGVDWESGTATLTESGGTYTITRGGSQTVNSSSNSGSAVSLSNSTTHTCFLSVSAATLQNITDTLDSLGTASESDVGDFATAAQGALADTSVQVSSESSETSVEVAIVTTIPATPTAGVMYYVTGS